MTRAGPVTAEAQAQALYLALVQHPLDAGALAAGLGAAPPGQSDAFLGALVAGILSSPEYQARAA